MAKRKKRKICHVDMDGVICDFDSIKPQTLMTDAEYDAVINANQFFLNLKPMPGALKALRWLDRHFDAHILSTAPWEAPEAWKEKRLWVEKYIPEFKKRLTLTHYKNLSIGDYLIDDRLKNGAGKFTGKFIHFGSHEFPDWKSVIDYLKEEERIT